jgi:hypothetical protein
MSRLASLFSKRVPFYVSLPVIVACGATGYVASTMRPGSAIIGQAQILRPVVAGHAMSDQASVPPRDAPSTTVPLAIKVDLPTPAPNIAGSERVPANVIAPMPPVHVTKAMSERPRATRAARVASKPRRPRRMARQPTSTPATAAAGLKGIPLIGPVFSLLQ